MSLHFFNLSRSIVVGDKNYHPANFSDWRIIYWWHAWWLQAGGMVTMLWSVVFLILLSYYCGDSLYVNISKGSKSNGFKGRDLV